MKNVRITDDVLLAIMEQVRDGKYLKTVIEEMPEGEKISLSGFKKRVGGDPALKAMWREVIAESGDMWAEKADAIVEDCLKKPETDPKRAQIAIEHYRWRAEKANPQRYGQRQTLEHTGDSESYVEAMKRAQPIIKAAEGNVVKLESKGKVA